MKYSFRYKGERVGVNLYTHLSYPTLQVQYITRLSGKVLFKSNNFDSGINKNILKKKTKSEIKELANQVIIEQIDKITTKKVKKNKIKNKLNSG